MAYGILQVTEGLGIQDGLLELGIVGKTDGAQVAGSHLAVIGTDGITGGGHRNAGVQAFGEHLVDAVRAGSGGGGSRIREIRDRLFQVAQDLLVDDIPAFLVRIDGLGSKGLETGGDVTPGLGQVIVNHRPERERFAEEIGHVRLFGHLAVFAKAFDDQIGTLDAHVHQREGPVGKIQLTVVGLAVIRCDIGFPVTGLIGIVPFDIRIETVPGQETTAVGVHFAEGLGDAENRSFRQRIVGIHGGRIEGRRRFGIQEFVAGNHARQKHCSSNKVEYLFHICFHFCGSTIIG